jgi:hypothetical protein
MKRETFRDPISRIGCYDPLRGDGGSAFAHFLAERFLLSVDFWIDRSRLQKVLSVSRVSGEDSLGRQFWLR